MRFLKKRIEQAKAVKIQIIKNASKKSLKNDASPQEIHSNDSPGKTNNKRKRIPGICLTSETSRETKNIVKNYGKAICKFIISPLALPYLNVILKKEDVNPTEFINFVKSCKNRIDGLHHFRSVLMEDKKDNKETAAYKRIFKELSEIFIKFFSVNWIFDSKIVHKQAHLMFRFKMLRRIRCPELFTYLKDSKKSSKKTRVRKV